MKLALAKGARLSVCALALSLAVSMPALADDTGSADQTSTKSTSWASTIKGSFQVEGSVSINPDNPRDGINYASEFNDRANTPMFNQAQATLVRPVDTSKAFDLGFNVQAVLGSDARYYPTVGMTEKALTGRTQLAFTQANVVLHARVLTPEGIDVKVGLSPGAMGYEAADPTQRPFYTVSYMTNFMVPFETLGVIATLHVNPHLDLIGGVDKGNEVTFGTNDNNHRVAEYFGFALKNLLHDRLNILAMGRIGPENSLLVLPDADHKLRYWNDVTATYKASDRLSFAFEGNYMRDDGLKADAYGLAGYASYVVTPDLTLNGRSEVMRDNTGSFVMGFGSDTAFLNGIIGKSDAFITAPPTTYGAWTIGLSYKPPQMNQGILHTTIRPEIRYDRSLNGTRPFDGSSQPDQFLFSADLILGF